MPLKKIFYLKFNLLHIFTEKKINMLQKSKEIDQFVYKDSFSFRIEIDLNKIQAFQC